MVETSRAEESLTSLPETFCLLPLLCVQGVSGLLQSRSFFLAPSVEPTPDFGLSFDQLVHVGLRDLNGDPKKKMGLAL